MEEEIWRGPMGDLLMYDALPDDQKLELLLDAYDTACEMNIFVRNFILVKDLERGRELFDIFNRISRGEMFSDVDLEPYFDKDLWEKGLSGEWNWD